MFIGRCVLGVPKQRNRRIPAIPCLRFKRAATRIERAPLANNHADLAYHRFGNVSDDPTEHSGWNMPRKYSLRLREQQADELGV